MALPDFRPQILTQLLQHQMQQFGGLAAMVPAAARAYASGGGMKNAEPPGQAFDDALRYYLGPTGIPDRLAAVNQIFNPVEAIGQAMASGREMSAPNRTPWQRLESTGDMLSGVAGVVAPVIGSARGAVPVANAITDAMTGYSPAMGAMGDFAVDEAGSLRLYHGSPHDFDKFSLEKIGTGEGAQGYGHGLYFTDSETGARHYRDKVGSMLGTGELTVDGRKIDWENPYEAAAFEVMRHGGDRDAAASFAERMFRGSKVPSIIRSGAELPEIRSSGHMYEVEVNANASDFIDLDLPLSQQPEAIQKIARDADLSGVPSRLRRKIEHWRGDDADEPGGSIPEPSGNDLHSALTDYGNNKKANADLTAKLKSAGFPGFRHADRGSESAGARNYVVFDDALINMLRKYSIAGMTAGGGAMALETQPDAITGRPMAQRPPRVD